MSGPGDLNDNQEIIDRINEARRDEISANNQKFVSDQIEKWDNYFKKDGGSTYDQVSKTELNNYIIDHSWGINITNGHVMADNNIDKLEMAKASDVRKLVSRLEANGEFATDAQRETLNQLETANANNSLKIVNGSNEVISQKYVLSANDIASTLGVGYDKLNSDAKADFDKRFGKYYETRLDYVPADGQARTDAFHNLANLTADVQDAQKTNFVQNIIKEHNITHDQKDLIMKYDALDGKQDGIIHGDAVGKYVTGDKAVIQLDDKGGTVLDTTKLSPAELQDLVKHMQKWEGTHQHLQDGTQVSPATGYNKSNNTEREIS